MRRVLAALLALPLAALAAIVTLSTEGTVTLSTGATCAVESAKLDTRAKALTVQCKAAPELPPAPPVDPPIVTSPSTPPVVTPQPPAPPVPGVVMLPFPKSGISGAGSLFVGTPGVAYAFPVPATLAGGSIVLTGEGAFPLMGSDGNVEISLSKIAGDFTVCKGYSVPASFGRTVFPYYISGSTIELGFNWTLAIDKTGRPVIPPGETWYFNYRITRAAQGNGIVMQASY